MKLTIIKEDKSVYIDNVCYQDLSLPSIPINVHALQFQTDINLGHIEFVQVFGEAPVPNEEITEIPSWATLCIDAWNNADYIAKHPPAPTPEELLTICKTTAKANLADTDWSELPSVSDPSTTPHLLNTAEFVQYRNVIRGYVVTPVVDPVWPTKPTAQWS
jgi:hypothetical protein